MMNSAEDCIQSAWSLWFKEEGENMINYSDLYKCSIKHLIKIEYLTGHFDVVAFTSLCCQGKWKLALTSRSVGFFSL